MDNLDTKLQQPSPSLTQSKQEDQNDTGGDYFTPYTAGIFHITNKADLIYYDARFEFLSPPIEKLLFDFSTAEFIEEKLGVKFGLSRSQKKRIADIVREVLLGDIFIGDVVKETQTKLEVDENKAKEVASMVVAELFPPALESIKRVQRLRYPLKIQELARGQQEKPDQPMPRPATPPIPRPLPPRPEVQSKPLTEVGPQGPPVEVKLQQPAQQSSPQAVRPAPFQAPPKPPLDLKSPEVEPQRPPPVEVRLQQPVQQPFGSPREDSPPQRPQFKVPNINSDLSGIRVPPLTPADKAEGSLEKELEKVANVIDLRNKPNE